jgi:hypothetical protein
MARIYGGPGALWALVAAAAIGLAACGGSSSTPQVASLGNGSGGSGSSGGAQSGNPTRLLDEWASCMRSHGDPDQADPVIDSDRDIDITITGPDGSALSAQVHAGSGPCSSFLKAASLALSGGQPAPTSPPLAQLEKFSECMRANGVPGYPDPSGNGTTDFKGTGVDPDSPAVQNASKVCVSKTGMPAFYATGASPPGVISVMSCNAPAGKQCPSGGAAPAASLPGGPGADG